MFGGARWRGMKVALSRCTEVGRKRSESGEAIGGANATGGKIGIGRNDGRLWGGQETTGGARIQRPAGTERGTGARAIRRGLGTVRIDHPAVVLLRANRRAAGRAQEARGRARG